MAAVDILFWVSVFSGGVLALLMILSIFGGLDLDLDVDIDGGDADVDGGFGALKSVLTTIAVGAWVARIVILKDINPLLAMVIGLACGALVAVIFIWLFKLFLTQQKEVIWDNAEAIGQTAKVYLTVPETGTGIVLVQIAGARRELRAVSRDGIVHATGAEVMVVSVNDENQLEVKAIHS